MTVFVTQEVGKSLRVLGLAEGDLESCLSFLRRWNLQSSGQHNDEDESRVVRVVQSRDFAMRFVCESLFSLFECTSLRTTLGASLQH